MKHYSVVITNRGLSPLWVVKTLMDHTHYGLYVAKCLVDNLDMVYYGSNRTKARQITKTLREAGATIKSTIITF